ncbi:hypothetical protein [Janthinobacterium lividum]|uniref:hypothetical protein n=1 Tax=Janthinobacterium lividum TaxID=29581 RepID=UPI00044C2062|nr:hypothetical protein [Janthinobacterium lividum]EZP41862.1 Kap p-loop domain-containing protein [Janthinobacterium lividum]
MEYYLPLPDSRKYAESLFFNSTLPPAKNFITFEGELTFSNYEFFPLMFSVYADHFGCGLRDQFQAMKIFEAALYSVKERKIHLHFLMFLTMLYQRSPTVYEEVFRSRAITDVGGYSAIVSKLPDVGFRIQRRSPSGEYYQALVSPLAVARVYLESIFLSSKELNRSTVIHEEFPNVLIDSLRRNASGQEYKQHYVSEYFNIIRSAGAFSDRIGS